MADAAITSVTVAGHTRAMRTMVWVTSEIGYCFNIGSGTDLDYVKTTNGGKTWGAAVDIFTGTVSALDVWYDQWTPGDTGRCVHIAYIEDGTDDVAYVRFNTVNDAQDVEVDIASLTSTLPARGVFCSITKSRGGNLYCAFDIDAGTEHGFYKSTDNGATWSSMTSPIEATLDQCKLFPANAVDPNDIWALYDDDSATELTVKTYDDSGNSFSESAALTFDNEPTDATGQYGFDGAIRHSDGHLIFAFFNAFDAVGTDFLCYDWDGTTATALTALTTDKDDMYYPNVFINNDTNYIYIAYVGLSDGTQTLRTTATVYYALSKNNGATWTMDNVYSSTSTDWAQTWTALNGERFAIAYWDISGTDIFGNYDKSIDFGFTKLNNFQGVRAVGQNNTGIISVAGGIK